MEYKAYPGFNPNEVRTLFEERGWYTRIVTPDRVGLVAADQGSHVKCIDGRHGLDPDKDQLEGPKLPGGIDCIAALVTGGCEIGLNAAAKAVEEHGFKPGTHVDCGFHLMWRKGQLKAAVYPVSIPSRTVEHLGGIGRWINLSMRLNHGRHFPITGVHLEEAVIFNPYEDMTVRSRSDRFVYDHWLIKRMLNGKGRQAKHLLAETVEKLKPDAMKLEIVVAS